MRRADTAVDERPSPQVRQRLAWKPAAFSNYADFYPSSFEDSSRKERHISCGLGFGANIIGKNIFDEW